MHEMSVISDNAICMYKMTKNDVACLTIGKSTSKQNIIYEQESKCKNVADGSQNVASCTAMLQCSTLTRTKPHMTKDNYLQKCSNALGSNSSLNGTSIRNPLHSSAESSLHSSLKKSAQRILQRSYDAIRYEMLF